MALISGQRHQFFLDERNRGALPAFGKNAYNRFESQLNSNYTSINSPNPNTFNLLALHEVYKASPESMRKYALRIGVMNLFAKHCTELNIDPNDTRTLPALFQEFLTTLPSEAELLQSYENLMENYTTHFEEALRQEGVDSENLEVIGVNFGTDGPEFLLEDKDNPGYYSVFTARNNGENTLHLLSKAEEASVIGTHFATSAVASPSRESVNTSSPLPKAAQAPQETRVQSEPSTRAKEAPSSSIPKPRDTEKHTLASGTVASRAAMFDAPKPSTDSRAPAAPTRKTSALADRTAKFNSQANQTTEAAPAKKTSKWAAIDTAAQGPAAPRKEKTAEEKAAYAKKIGTHSAGKAAEATERDPDPTPTGRGPRGH